MSKTLPKFILDYLNDRGIGIKASNKRNLSATTASETKKEFGKAWPGLKIPYYTPRGKLLIDDGSPFSRIRVWPKQAKGFSAKIKKGPKFLQKKGALNHPYLDPTVKNWLRICMDTSITITITEGEIKAMAAIEHGLICIAVSGVWSWKTKIDGVSIPMEELDWFVWENRIVELVFDSDIDNNDQVKAALQALAAELIRRGATAYQVSLPKLSGEEKNTGLDDYLMIKNIEEYKELPRTYALNPIISELNSKHSVISIGGKVSIMTEFMDPIFPGRRNISFSKPADMKTKYANRKITIKYKTVVKGEEVEISKSTTAYEYWISHPARKEYNGVVFSPNKEVLGYYNLWHGFAVNPIRGDCKLFKSHIKTNISQGDSRIYNYIWAWMADAVQNPADRPGIALVMRGKQGTGKGVLANMFGSLFGQHYIQVSDSRHLLGNFNSHLKDKLIVFADEAFWAGDKTSEGVLKRMITEPTIDIEPKFQDVIQIENLIRIIIAGNDTWVVPAGLEERRMFVIDVGDKHIQDRRYFKAIKKQMDEGGREALLYELINYDLDEEELYVIPQTQALLEQKIHSMDSIAKFWSSKLQSGILRNSDGNWGESKILCSSLQDQYIEFAKEAGFSRRATDTELGMKLKKLCPAIYKKQCLDNATQTRFYYYYLPDLKTCRKLFEEVLNMEVNW